MQIRVDHPALAGHFPGHPVVPGVMLLDAVADQLEVEMRGPVILTGFKAVKFLSLIRPDQEFQVTFRDRQAGQARFEIETLGQIAVSGTVSFEAS